MKEQQLLTCDNKYCYYFTTSKVNLNYHLKTKKHLNQAGLKCKVKNCLHKVETKNNMVRHLKDHLEYDRRLVCSVCGLTCKAFPKAFYRHTIACKKENKMSLGFILN